ncbi:MAG: ribonuclease H-like domain-containing protein [bacterium]|nr:ribonuclease H-like domain-containing protein [bacterium]
MKTLIFDIETIGERWEEMDEGTRAFFEQKVREKAESEEDVAEETEELKAEFGLSPLTGQVVAIGVLDADSGKGAVYFQARGEEIATFEEDSMKYEAMDEPAMLKKFWDVAQYAITFVSFNGRTFDAPFLALRSAAHRIRPTKDLMRGRYLYQQLSDARHIDLKDQLTFYGAFNKRHALHLYCRAFGIESSKEGGMDGSDVGRLFAEGKFLDIARYNARDLRATKDLYEVWRLYVQA